ncbi:MAG: GYD domain-containing protein [bacterium]|nr:MAG: GYD domain-containing protein [bacterium]
MPVSMIQFSYKSETVEKLINNPEDRSLAVKELLEKLGGKLLAFYYSYGEYDGVVLAEMPDNISGLAATMTSFAAGGTENIKTTILITVEEAMAAMKKASGLKLEQPKG